MKTKTHGLFRPLMAICLVALSAMALSACSATSYQRQHQTSELECKQLQSRGLISLEQKRLCIKGQSYQNFSEQAVAQESQKSPCPCCEGQDHKEHDKAKPCPYQKQK